MAIDQVAQSTKNQEVAQVDPLREQYGATMQKPASNEKSGEGSKSAAESEAKSDEANRAEKDGKFEVSLNPKFANSTEAELGKLLEDVNRPEDLSRAIEAYKELIARSDIKFDGTESGARSAIEKDLQSLDSNKKADGEALSPLDRYNLQQDISEKLQTWNTPVELRLHLAAHLHEQGNHQDAELLIQEAIRKADSAPRDLTRRAMGHLYDDMDRAENADVKMDLFHSSTQQRSTLELPIYARRDLTLHYLGSNASFRIDRESNSKALPYTVKGEGPSFNPDKAFDVAEEMRHKTAELMAMDPLGSDSPSALRYLYPSGNYNFNDVPKEDLYASVEKYSNRQFGNDRMVRSNEFALRANSMFEKIDSNKDGYLNLEELDQASRDKSFDAREAQVLAGLKENVGMLSAVSPKDLIRSSLYGITRSDLDWFEDADSYNTERLHRMHEARKLMLSTNAYDEGVRQQKALHPRRNALLEGIGATIGLNKDSFNRLAERPGLTPEQRDSLKYLGENVADMMHGRETINPFRIGLQKDELKNPSDYRVEQISRSMRNKYYDIKPGT